MDLDMFAIWVVIFKIEFKNYDYFTQILDLFCIVFISSILKGLNMYIKNFWKMLNINISKNKLKKE